MATKHTIEIQAKDKASRAINKVDKGLDRTARRALMLKGAIGIAGAAIAALGTMVVFKRVIDDMDNLAKAARNVGITSEKSFAKFQVIRKLLEEGGLSAEETDRMFRNLEGRMAAGIAGNKQYAEIMAKLGDSIFDVNGKLKDAPDLFTAVAQAMQEGTIGMADAQKILGEMVGPKVLGVFQQLKQDGVGVGKALADVADSMNIVSLEDAQRAEVFNDSLSRLGDQLTYLMQEALIPILPYMTEFVKDLAASAPGYLEKFKNAMAAMQPLFDVIGIVLTDVLVPALKVFFEFISSLAEVMKPIYEAALPLFKLALEAVSTALEFITDTIKEFEDEIIGTIEVVTDFGNKIKDNFGSIKDSVVNATEATTSKLKELWSGAYDYLVGNSIVPELKEEIVSEFREMQDMTTTATTEQVDSIISDYDRLQKAMIKKTGEMKEANNAFVEDFNKQFNDVLADGLVEGNLNFDSFAGLWKSTLKDLISDTLNGGNQLNSILGQIGSLTGGGFNGGVSGMFGGLSSFATNVVGGISDFFGGFFADGGKLGAGKFGIAGEAGAEIVTGPANITPMNQLAAPAAPPVNITIQSIDTQTGTEFLLKNKNQIEGIIQNAYNRRGRQGIY